MEPNQNEGQQTVDNVKLIVASQLHIEGDEYFYKLLVKDVVDAKREDRRKLHLNLGRKEEKFEEFSYEDELINEYYLLPVEALVLAPGIEALIEIDILVPKYKSILSKNKYISYDESLFSDIYKILDGDYEIIFPIEVTKLNEELYGNIVDVKSSNPRSSLHFKYINGAEYYEVKLLKPLFIDGKNYKNVWLPSKGLLKGFRVGGITLNPVSLFPEYFSKKDEKLILIANFAEKEDVLNEDDLKLFGWSEFYKSLVSMHGWFILIMTFLIIWLNAMTAIDFGKNWPLLFVTFGTIWLTWIFHTSKNEKIKKLKPERKDDLLEFKKIANIKGMVFWTIIWAIMLFSFSKIYTYNSPYVYDSKEKRLIKESSFAIDMNEIFSIKKVSERYIHVYDKFDNTSLFYKNKNEKVTADTQFLALDVLVQCNYGEHLVDIKPYIAKASVRLQNDISAGKFGNWDKENILEDSDFQKSLVDVRKTLWTYIVDEYSETHKFSIDFISDITITPRYTKLQ
jgi:hypothetical protein